jgi:phosphoglycolate phosphatase-like HAD superfamily hydrolase
MIRYRLIDFVMFDADGVLFDSFESNISYYNAIFEKVGEPPLDQQEEVRSISCSSRKYSSPAALAMPSG